MRVVLIKSDVDKIRGHDSVHNQVYTGLSLCLFTNIQ